MRIVAALGVNALLRRGEPLTVEAQRHNVAEAAAAVAALAAEHRSAATCRARASPPSSPRCA